MALSALGRHQRKEETEYFNIRASVVQEDRGFSGKKSSKLYAQVDFQQKISSRIMMGNERGVEEG